MLAFGAILWFGGMGVWSAVAKSSAFLDGKVCVYRGKTKQNGFGVIQYCI